MHIQEFHNRLRSLHCIEPSEIPGLSADRQRGFATDPVRFFIRCDDETAAKIWALVEARQQSAKQRAA